LPGILTSAELCIALLEKASFNLSTWGRQI